MVMKHLDVLFRVQIFLNKRQRACVEVGDTTPHHYLDRLSNAVFRHTQALGSPPLPHSPPHFDKSAIPTKDNHHLVSEKNIFPTVYCPMQLCTTPLPLEGVIYLFRHLRLSDGLDIVVSGDYSRIALDGYGSRCCYTIGV